MDFIKELAKEFVKEIEIHEIPEFRAILFQDGQLVANGIAMVSDGGVLFHPENSKPLEHVLHGKVVLKVLENDILIPLQHNDELLEIGSAMIWCFEKVG